MATAIPAADSSVIWEPRSAPQEAFIACPVFEIFFGGARGSLKTDSVIADWNSHSDQYGKDAKGLMVRRTREELSETIARADEMLTPLGYVLAGHVLTGPTGSRLTFAYLEREKDALRYQGWSLTRVYVEEIGNFPSPGPILKLMATLRSAVGIPVGFRATGNPGGPGHQWVKARYIDFAPKGWEVADYRYVNPFNGEEAIRQRLFIPGKITDHNLLGPEYIAQLQMSGSESLVRAWLLGDWDVIEGAYFDGWQPHNHVIKPFSLPEHWLRFRSMDWGSSRPFSVGWWAVVSEDTTVESGVIPKGAIVRYREWYGAKEPNVGLKLTVEAVAQGIADRTEERITYTVVDPSMMAQNGGPSMAERMLAKGIPVRPGDNKRIPGWEQMRARLDGEDDRPMLYTFTTCKDFIRTLPSLQHDEVRPEDLDTDGEDHAADETRYACMSRPYSRPAPGEDKPRFGTDRNFNELRDLVGKRRGTGYE
jgi:hypothetical protein